MDIQLPENVLKRKPIPVIILVDVSYSMEGPGITSANEGLRRFIDDFKNDAAFNESVLISIITFSDTAKTIIDHEPVANVTPPTLSVEGSTLLDEGISEVINLVNRHSQELRGVKEPLFCLITDGNPSTADWKAKLDEMNDTDFIGKSPKSGKKTSFRLLCGAGNEVDDDVIEAFRHDKEKCRIMRIDSVDDAGEFIKYCQTVTEALSSGTTIPEPDSGTISLVFDGSEED